MQKEIEQTEKENNENTKYKKGEQITFVRVRFPGNAKSFPFAVGKRDFKYGQKVIAMSDRGMAVGYINSFEYNQSFNKSLLPIKYISRTASEQDITGLKDNIDQEKKSEYTCIELIEKHKLDMTLTHVELLQFGKKAVFYFSSPSRVDFRDLVKDLVKELKIRIELRQISTRDRTAALGGIGACGLQTCCSSFLKNYGSVNMKMAKNQNLALVPSKLNGICNQIKCCTKFEDEVYSNKRKKLPKEGSFAQLINGDTGRISKLYVLKEQFIMQTDQGKIKRYSSSMYDSSNAKPKSSWSFPRKFEFVANETDVLIEAQVSTKNTKNQESNPSPNNS
ncbi:MAG: stage 0 sporulation protein [Bdellovibrionales bacterium]|jgi:cell fate regulator YaaT (PSP1 superfamily)|nr:stage 0 sporulation protein [Bdellovibrionales bacterium]